jgi:hypothetical protein
MLPPSNPPREAGGRLFPPPLAGEGARETREGGGFFLPTTPAAAVGGVGFRSVQPDYGLTRLYPAYELSRLSHSPVANCNITRRQQCS